MDLMNYVDVSSSILFEATADSEADSDINRNMDGALLTEDTGLADDDALSCSCDGIDLNDFDQYPTSTADHDQFDLVVYDDDHRNLDHRDEEVEEDEDEDEEGVVDQLWNGDNNCNNKSKDLKIPTTGRSLANYSPDVLMKKRQRRKKLKICAEEFVNQREKDKLFWETCLAS